jgi:nitrous oxide reductase accessory protein NosL
MIARRTFLGLALVLAACRGGEKRCPHCGMKIDEASAYRAELEIDGKREVFDTPRCALTEWKTRGKGTPFLQDYYGRTLQDGSALRFVIGSDVVGPMGPEIVPVTPDREAKLVKDHGGKGYALAELTPELLAQ